MDDRFIVPSNARPLDYEMVPRICLIIFFNLLICIYMHSLLNSVIGNVTKGRVEELGKDVEE